MSRRDLIRWPGKPIEQSLVVFITYLFVAVVTMVLRYAALHTGAGELHYDPRLVWLPIASELAAGETLYVTTTFDNKSPLFHALNYLVYLTGHYVTVFYALIALGNATVAYLLYYWLRANELPRAGLIAGLLYVVSMPHVDGNVINVRTFALIFLVGALLTARPWRRGGLFAVSALFSQYSVFALPVLWYDGIRRSEATTPFEWTTKFAVSGLLVGILCYLPLLAWGTDALRAGIEANYLSIGEYAMHREDDFSPVTSPLSWAEALGSTALALLYLLVPAGMILGYSVWRRRLDWTVGTVSGLLALSFATTLLIKSLYYYWMPVVAFLAPVVGIGVVRFVRAKT